MSRLRMGTASFSTKGWVGSFYPEGTKPADYLAHYAKEFDTVEVDSTYYGVPRPTTVERWAERTPEGFRFAAKFPRGIVHCGEGPRPDADAILVPERVGEELEEFVQAMRILGPKCGPLVLQFPYFGASEFAGPGPFLERLDAFFDLLPEDFRYAVEVRNRSWLGRPLIDLLVRRRAALVLVDIKNMPHPDELSRRLDLVTTDFTYGRLIGDRRAVDARTKTFDKIVIDRGTELDRWALLLHELLERVDEAYVFANNHFAGHGPATVRQLQERMAPDDTPF